MENIKQAISFDNFYKLAELNKDNYCMTYELSDEIKNRTKIVYNKYNYLSNLENSFIDKNNFLYESITKIFDNKSFGIIPIEDFFENLKKTFELILNKIKQIFETSLEEELKEIYIHYHEINKSNFWLSLLLCKYLTDNKLNDNIKKKIFFIDDVELMKNRDKQIKKNIFFIDDCSYSGTQLNGIIDKYYDLYNIHNRSTLKFIKFDNINLNKIKFNDSDLKDIDLNDIDLNEKNICKYYNDNYLLNNIEEIYLIISKKDIDLNNIIKLKKLKEKEKENENITENDLIISKEDIKNNFIDLNNIIKIKKLKENIKDNIYNVEEINVFTIYISKFAHTRLINNFKNKFSLSYNIILNDIGNDEELFKLLIDNSYVFVEEIDNKEIVLIDIIQYLGINKKHIIPKLLEIKSADSLSSLQYLYNYIKPPILNIENINNVKLYKLKETFKVIHTFNNYKIGKKFINTDYNLIDHKNLKLNINIQTKLNINIQTTKQFGLLEGCYNLKYYKCLDKEFEIDYKNDELCYSAFYRKEKFIFNEYIINFFKNSCVKNENLKFIEDYDKKTTDNIISGGNLNIYYKLKYLKYIKYI